MLDRIIMTPGKQITLGVSALANPYYQLLGIRRKWLDQAQPLCGVAWYLVCVREGTVLGLSTLLGASVRHPSPRIGVCTVCPEAGKEPLQRFRACESSHQVATAATTAILPRSV